MAMDPLSIGNESPPARQSILGSLLRGRPRGTSQSHPSPPHNDVLTTRDSPSPPNPQPPQPNQDSPNTNNNNLAPSGHRRRPAAVSPNLQHSHSTNIPQSAVAGFSQMLRRRRSAGALATTTTPQVPAIAVARTAIGAPSAATANPTPNTAATNLPSRTANNTTNPSAASHRIRLVPHLDSRRSLRFDPICRDVREGDSALRIGRFTDRTGLGLAAANAMGSNKLAFKSKVVSRAHAEIWVESGGRFFIKDTKSSSGTFLNHVRLSPANTESLPKELKDGDLLQLGVDYQGGTEDIYKCVKIKVEVNREWQAHSNPFNANALKQLRAIAAPLGPTAPKKTVSSKSALPDCCICLFAVTINQALFIAPCSHAFHYKCIRPLLESHHPAFSCPLCRTFANLDEDVEVEIEDIEGMAGDVSAMIESLGVDQAHESTPPQQTPVVNVIPTSSSGGVSGQQPLPPIPQSTPPGPQQLSRPPSAGNERGSHSRERHHHDPGAETEVEPDSGGLGRFRSGAGNGTFRARGAVPPLPLPNGVNGGAFMGVDVIEDVDQEMEDLASPLPQHFALPGVAATAVGGGIGVVVERDEDIVEDVVGVEGQEGSEEDDDGRIEEASHGSKRKR